MKRVTLKRIEMENFKCFKHKTVEFGSRTSVRGRNGVGKSTLYNAMLWCLFGKDSVGNNATDVRPHDTDGNVTHFVDISVSCTFDVGGREITLKKTERENYVKDRATKEQTFKGNDSFYECNGIPKKASEYKAYIAANFCDEDTFLSCTNASAFYKLDVKKRRAKLMELASDMKDSDIIATDAAFEPLADMLMDGTVDELIARSKGVIKRHNDELKTIPVRIDEQERKRVDVDTAELELAKNEQKRRIEEIEAQQASLSEQYADYQKASDGVLELQFAINDIKRRAAESTSEERHAIYAQQSDKISEKSKIERIIADAKTTIDVNEKLLPKYEKEKGKQEKLYSAAVAQVFDTESLVCPYCGQEYPEAKKDALRADFEANRAKAIADADGRLKEIEEVMQRLARNISIGKEELATAESDLAKNKAELDALDARLIELDDSVGDLTGNPEYQKLAAQIAEKEAFLARRTTADEARADLDRQKQEAQAELERVNTELAKAQLNMDVDSRIEELRSEQVSISQKEADEQRQLDLLERFNRVRMEALTDRINGNFRMVKWKLFQEQINGGYTDVCYALVDGSNREKGLNDSDCLLADLDILESFQRINGLELPLFLDRAESINNSRIPETDCQLITLEVSEDKELTVISE